METSGVLERKLPKGAIVNPKASYSIYKFRKGEKQNNLRALVAALEYITWTL